VALIAREFVLFLCQFLLHTWKM